MSGSNTTELLPSAAAALFPITLQLVKSSLLPVAMPNGDMTVRVWHRADVFAQG